MAKEGLSSIFSGLGGVLGDSLGGLGDLLKKAPGIMPGGGISEAGATTAGMDDETPISIVGDGWKPHKPTLLGSLADAYLASKGMKPAFADQRDEANLQEAMQGFTGDPMKAIKRIAQIRGHASDAFSMYDKVEDNRRADDSAQSLQESRQDKYLTRMGGLLRSIQGSNDPNAAYTSSMPILKTLASRAGVNDLPDNWDENYANTFISSSISPEDQVRMDALAEYRKTRGARDDRRLNITEDHYNTEEAQAAANEAGRNNRAATSEQGRNARFQARPSAKSTSSTMTKYGPGMINKDGNKMVVVNNGKHYGYVKTGVNPDGTINWTPIGEVKLK